MRIRWGKATMIDFSPQRRLVGTVGMACPSTYQGVGLRSPVFVTRATIGTKAEKLLKHLVVDALAERHGLRHANDHWQRFTMCSVYHCGKGGSTDASQSTRQAGAELPVCIRMTRERFKAAHPTLIALPTMPDVSIAGPRRPRYSSYFKSLRQGQ